MPKKTDTQYPDIEDRPLSVEELERAVFIPAHKFFTKEQLDGLKEIREAALAGELEWVKNADGMMQSVITRGRKRKPESEKKRMMAFKLSPQVIDGIRSSGKGFTKRVEAVLRDALAKGLI